MRGQVVVITGANTGIGKVNATLFARLGAKVVMGCRDMAKAHIAAEDIRRLVTDADVEVLKLDLSSLGSVRQFAKECGERVQHISLLVNNAGLMFCPNWRTEDGFEMQFGTNHLGHFLLTLLLMDKLKSAPKARIINVSSIAHMTGEINFDDINSNQSYNKYRAYYQSKLANVLFTRELASRLTGTQVTAYSLHPGLVDTGLWKYMSGCLKLLNIMFKSITNIEPELGAQTTHYCALEPSIANESGFYYKFVFI
ncbi:unnamed protein product [Oppiella nova]|uniref:Uncharacterized protein n=1 Tax=Oppiella nova TaxID=334625 RepID=A0A7R9MDG3_9ACAR|nr:unnamed protein product [Oppiella nova]CAG2175170.1 unnamed protein product [Oppiella nova]